MNNDVQFEPTDVLAYSLPAHRRRWDGSVCEEAATWQCGARDWYRSQHCVDGQGCMSKTAFVENGPVLRSVDADLLHICDTVGWSKMADQWVLLHGFAERSGGETGQTSVAESTLYGIYILESARQLTLSATNVVDSSVESTGSHQAILKPYPTEWLRFPPDLSLVWDRETEFVEYRNRTGFVKRSTIDRLLDQAMQVAEDSRGTAHWSSTEHDRFVRFYNKRFELAHRLLESTSSWSAAAWETLSSLDVLYDRHIGLDADVAPRQKPPEPRANPEPAILSPPFDVLPLAPTEETVVDTDSSPVAAPSAIDSGDLGSDRLAFDAWLELLQVNAANSLVSSNDLQILCALLIAGELVLLDGPAMDDALDCLADSLISGELHESAPGPATIEFVDLLEDRSRERPTALEQARREALANPKLPFVACLVGIDNAPFEFWIHALHRWSRSRHRPDNLLICATVAHDPERAARSGFIRYAFHHQEISRELMAPLLNADRSRRLATLEWTSLPCKHDPVETLDKAVPVPEMWTLLNVKRVMRLQRIASAFDCIDDAAYSLLRSIDTSTAVVQQPASDPDTQQ